MKKITFAMVWVVSFLLLLLVCDQFLLRYPGENTPLFSDFQHFYQDFRQRVIKLGFHVESNHVESKRAPMATTVKNRTTVEEVLAVRADEVLLPKSTANGVRYIYVDGDDTLSFADRWEDIPPALRAGAKQLDN